MSATRALAAAAAVLACTAQSPAGVTAPETPQQVLARVKSVFRSYARPAFVSYTVARRDRENGVVDFANSYTLKVWCRTADRSALVRRAWNGKAYGDLENITVTFDREVDPGPPTADMFEKRLFGSVPMRAGDGAPAQPLASPDPSSPHDALTEIGRVTALDGDYRAGRMAREGDLLHLWLEPRTDADRNRLDEIWVDARSYDLRRALVRDHLYVQFGTAIEDEFDVRFRPGPGNLPLIASIHGQTRYGNYETDYTFSDVTFPASLPDWYFAPRQYGLHRADAPN